MCDAIRVIADFEDRSIMDECRHLIRLGLEQEWERLRCKKWPPNRILAAKRFFQLFGER
jgi:hypothetical protein